MQSNKVKIGEDYYLISLKEAIWQDRNYRVVGYSKPCGLDQFPEKMKLFGKQARVTVSNPVWDGHREGLYSVLGPDGKKWVVMCEWLVERNAPICQKKGIRFIRS